MKKNRSCLLTLAISLCATAVFSQNVAINEDGSAPNPNAILDVKSFTKGVLIPRVSTNGRQSIPNTKGLLVYDTTAGAFWYNTGTAWQSLAAGDAAWSLTGNNITDTFKFLGTTGFMPLLVKVNSQPAGRIDLDYPGNTFWGYRTGALIPPYNNTGTFFGTYNTAIGGLSLSSNTGGGGNTASGYNTLRSNTSGYYNTATGISALYSNTTGNNNIASGAYAMYANTSGKWNTVTGVNTMAHDTSGNENTISGFQSFYYNGSGSYNTTSGAYSLFADSAGDYNTAIGYSAIGNINSGSYNTAVGVSSMSSNRAGSNNTAVGAYATIGENLTNATAIGYNASVNASNKVRIGNSAVTVIEGQVSFTTPSDGRFKYHVQEDVKGLGFIMQLRPVTYQFDVKRFDAQQKQGQNDKNAVPTSHIIQASYDEASAIRRSGFIAQEVEKAANASGYNFSGIIKPKTEQEHYSLSYESFVVPLVKGMQEQQKIIDAQNKKIEQLDLLTGSQQQSMEEQNRKSALLEQKLASLEQQVTELNQFIHKLMTNKQ